MNQEQIRNQTRRRRMVRAFENFLDRGHKESIRAHPLRSYQDLVITNFERGDDGELFVVARSEVKFPKLKDETENK